MSRWFPELVTLRVGDVPRTASPAPASGPADDSAAMPGSAAPGERHRDAMLQAFERDLDRRALRRGTRVTCVVGGDGVRYRIVPWNDELVGRAPRQLLAEHCFKEAYGELARGWTVRQHSVRHGAATLGCAIDTALLDRLVAIVQARRLKLVSLQPSLMHAYNEALPRFEPNPLWFVCAETMWTTVLMMSATEPLHVKQLPSSGLDLALSLDREQFALGHDGPRLPVHVAHAMGASAGQDEAGVVGWRCVDLHGIDALPWPHRRAA